MSAAPTKYVGLAVAVYIFSATAQADFGMERWTIPPPCPTSQQGKLR